MSQITETFLILMLSVNHVQYMATYITQVNISRAAGTRLLRLARMPTTSHELTGNIEVQEAGDITFSNVNFTYPNRKDVQVLHDVSFTIQRGGCVAIVGSSGSGKSTIAALLLKLYQPDTNTFSTSRTPNLTVSGIDIRQNGAHPQNQVRVQVPRSDLHCCLVAFDRTYAATPLVPPHPALHPPRLQGTISWRTLLDGLALYHDPLLAGTCRVRLGIFHDLYLLLGLL